MLPKKARLARATFPRKKPERRAAFSWGSVSFFKDPPGKAAVVISKKVLARAHERNRLRRRLYQALAHAGLPSTTSVVVFPRREALSVPFQELTNDIASADT